MVVEVVDAAALVFAAAAAAAATATAAAAAFNPRGVGRLDACAFFSRLQPVLGHSGQYRAQRQVVVKA